MLPLCIEPRLYLCLKSSTLPLLNKLCAWRNIVLQETVRPRRLISSLIGAIALRGVSPSFFVAKTLQQRSKLIKCLLLIGPDRLEDDAVTAIQIGGKHSQYAGRREILLAFANRDCALEPDHAPDKLRCRSCVQPELVDNFEFLTHGFKVVFRVVLFRRT